VKATWSGLAFRARDAWIAGWALWLVTGLLVPVPPWRAAPQLAREEAEARRLASDPALVPFWSVDLGGTVQQQALGPGWGPVEGLAAAPRYRRPLLPSVDLRFHSPAWSSAHLTVRVGPQGDGQIGRIGVTLDGESRGSIDVEGSGVVRSLPLGALPAGAHRVTFAVTPTGLGIAGVAIGSVPLAEPARNAGFVQWVAVGTDERPAFFPSAPDAKLPPEIERVDRWGLRGGYGFGVGPRVGPVAAALEATHGLTAAALVAILTGLGYASFVTASPARRLALAPLFSLCALALVFAALRIFGIGPRPGPVALGLVLVGALPYARRTHEEAMLARWRTIVASLGALAVLTFFAVRVVPPLDDQDLEVQGTAHALARRAAPMMVTDRGTRYFFAHPPLLHAWVAGTFALSGRLERVGDAEALAERAGERGPFVEPGPDEYPPAYYDLWQLLLDRFFTEPQLWPTRQVSVLLAALAVGWLVELAAAVAGSAAIGMAASLVLLTFPEFLIRGAYGGYFAVATFSTLGVLATLDRARPGWPGVGAGFLAALSEQKGLLVPAAWFVTAPAGSGLGRLAPGFGAALGVLAFAAWGLAVDAPAFVYDFLKTHVMRRLSLGDLRFAHDARHWYPSISELWVEFAARYGLLFTASAAAASVWALRSARAQVRACGAAVLIGALVYSLTDWRQTKHLSLLVAPALLALAAAVPPGLRARLLALAVLAAMIATNLATAWPLLRDFSALTPSTIW
jgi:hypothetical protein